MTAENMEYRVNARIYAEKLLLKRNPLDYQAYVETFRESLIDANPHQVESVVFALEKLESGGCILADEVGLGKTIEAGLVISQYRARRRFNILVIVPTSLAGQWNSELRKLFQIPSRIITTADKKKAKKDGWNKIFGENGVYIMGREFASRMEKEKHLGKKHWDLIVVDEAHEIFANVYRRFNTRTGEYKERSKDSATAGNLFRLFKRTPLLLLTATPIQNNILELWGLSSYILPGTNKSHLGQFNHFKELFIEKGEVKENKISELKERANNFLIRNLRVNAQEFMDYKFTERHCETLNFNMEDKEKELYNRISGYFERDDIYAYNTSAVIDLQDQRTGGMRNLLKMSYRRALGSSFSALVNSLKGIVARLEQMKAGEYVKKIKGVSTDDAENDEEDRELYGVEEDMEIRYQPGPGDIEGIDGEIGEVNGYIAMARELGVTGKDKLLVKWMKEIFQSPDRFYAKTVIFTTYTATQRHLLEILEKAGFVDDVVLFSGGTNRGEKEKADIARAIQIWEEEIGPTISPSEKPTGNILERTALVHYFKTRKKVFISTEAGAKGLNLQFCNVLVNYDLPWNPQRIEQRIGRCHRYGQQRDVLVINCINADNETEQRIYDILNNKFSLFKSLLGAGDDILGTMSKAYNFEFRVNEILNQCKTKEEINIRLEKLEAEINEKQKEIRSEKKKKTRNLIDELDPQVRRKLKDIKKQLPESFSRYDQDMLKLLESYARLKGVTFSVGERNGEQIFLEFDGRPFYIGKRDEENVRDYQHLDLKHPLMQEAIADIREDTVFPGAAVHFDYSGSHEPGEIIKPYVGSVGQWDFYRVAYRGFEEEERLHHIVSVNDNGSAKVLIKEEIDELLNAPIVVPGNEDIALEKDEDIRRQLEKVLEKESLIIQQSQQPRIDRKIRNLEVELRDLEECLKNEESSILADLNEIDKKINSTIDRETGKKLLEQKQKKQKDLKRCRSDLLEFQNSFQETFDQEELNLMEKRFIETQPEKIFSIKFKIK